MPRPMIRLVWSGLTKWVTATVEHAVDSSNRGLQYIMEMLAEPSSSRPVIIGGVVQVMTCWNLTEVTMQ